MQAPRGPHLQRHPVAGAWHDAEQAELAFARADDFPQRGATRLFTTAAVHRHAQLGARATQSNAPVLDGHEIPLLTPGQRAVVPRSWVLNSHRGATAG